MKHGFFPTVAWGNIKKNYRFFVPRILAETGLLSCLYITVTLCGDKRIAGVRGGDYVATFMLFGSVILALLSVILMLYTNSFLMKQRKREFGLYNVLGMEKRHIGRVLFFETAFCSLIAITLGIVLGMLFYKLCSLLICKLLQAKVILGFYYINMRSVLISALLFMGLDMFICVINRLTIARLKPVDMLSSISAGEKEPKIKWVLLVLGVLCLGGGYMLAVTAANATEALAVFFPAVFLVIFGTYFLFVAGSIFVLKALRRSKRYYYNRKHFITVSGLIYRMKQNAVGLASIAILATGVLVMVSTTVSLYAGMEQSLKVTYPQQLYLSASYDTDEQAGGTRQVPADTLLSIVTSAAGENGLTVAATETQTYLEVAFARKGSQLNTDRTNIDVGEITQFVFITEETYTSLGGEPLNLGTDELAVCAMSGTKLLQEKCLTLGDESFKVAKTIPLFPVNARMISSVDTFGAVVRDDAILKRIFDIQAEAYGRNASQMTVRLAVDFTDAETAAERDRELRRSIFNALENYVAGVSKTMTGSNFILETREAGREALVGMYGTFLFLGIILGTVCLFATALIVYYKQISEGYEDRRSFQIMKKVGLSDREIRSAVRKQIIWVFFLPLTVAGIHMCFAFPILEKMLTLLMLPDTAVFVRSSCIVFFVFAAVYVIIYSGTSKTYYKIVK